MNNALRKLFLLFSLLFILYLGVNTLNAPSQNAVRAICTGLSIDKENSETKVSAQIVIPEAGGQYTQKLVVVENKGKSIEEAIEKMEFQIGKKIRLGHCGFVVISHEYSHNDITKDFDYFLRGNNLGNNTLLLFTLGKASDVLESASNVNSNEVDNLQINSKYHERHIFSKSANMLSFFNDYLSPHQTSHMPNLTVEKKQASSQDSSSNEEQGSNSTQSSPKHDSIKSDGSVAIFYQGKFATLLSPSEREDFNWLDESISSPRVRIENINSKKLNDATLSFTITQKNTNFSYEFINNEPTIKVDFSLGLKPEAISQTYVPSYENIVDSVIENSISNKIKKALDNVLSIEKDKEFDVFNFYRQFNIHCHDEWQKYLKTLLPNEHYLKYIKIVSKVTCYDDF